MKILSTGFLVSDIIATDLPRVAPPSDVIYTPSSIELHVGGHPANLSIDLAKLGYDPKKIGVAGAVGNDIFGDFIEDTLNQYGLQVFLQRISEVGTSKNLILNVKGEDRRFHADVGVNPHLDPEYVKKTLEKYDPDLFYAAVGITGIDSRIKEILEFAKRKECITALDQIRPYEKNWDFAVPGLEFADIFHCNDVEALNITGEENVDSALEKLMSLGNSKIVFVSEGEEGAMMRTSKYRISQPSFEIDTKDPSGAGDAFYAGLFLKITEKGLNSSLNDPEELIDILSSGQATGALACTKAGTTAAVSGDEVDEILKKDGEKIREKTTIEEV